MLYIKTIISDHGRMVEGEGQAGDQLLALLTEARALSLKLECGVQFEFNGCLASITPQDDPGEQMVWLERVWRLLASRAAEPGGTAGVEA